MAQSWSDRASGFPSLSNGKWQTIVEYLVSLIGIPHSNHSAIMEKENLPLDESTSGIEEFIGLAARIECNRSQRSRNVRKVSCKSSQGGYKNKDLRLSEFLRQMSVSEIPSPSVFSRRIEWYHWPLPIQMFAPYFVCKTEIPKLPEYPMQVFQSHSEDAHQTNAVNQMADRGREIDAEAMLFITAVKEVGLLRATSFRLLF
ncbi:hypothetical protein OXYTRIMIC_588 [Oxytricha trifallax]|uniref:Uncharacterized protein n=1 Tax=Oxytricha trifallax TaxID=1172189 RepID=A0A073HZK6_9SPIT|nr:hypothetical protein OXYTRIMIC_588 [Oxytricha trifallax]